MVWDLLRTKKEKPAAGKTGYWRTFWRRRWDSNPRTLADQTISSRSRYDHFDTSPYLSQHQHLRKRGELMGRTKKNIQLKIPEKSRKIKGFRLGGYPIATTISSAAPSTSRTTLQNGSSSGRPIYYTAYRTRLSSGNRICVGRRRSSRARPEGARNSCAHSRGFDAERPNP